MAWFRTSGGRLIHGVGELAAVYAERGWEPVDDDAALAEIASGEAQTRADVEAEEAARVDATAPAKGKTRKVENDVGALTVSTEPTPITPGEQAAIDKVMDEEAPRKTTRRPPRKTKR